MVTGRVEHVGDASVRGRTAGRGQAGTPLDLRLVLTWTCVFSPGSKMQGAGGKVRR